MMLSLDNLQHVRRSFFLSFFLSIAALVCGGGSIPRKIRLWTRLLHTPEQQTADNFYSYIMDATCYEYEVA